jgi:hypothetical protein
VISFSKRYMSPQSPSGRRNDLGPGGDSIAPSPRCCCCCCCCSCCCWVPGGLDEAREAPREPTVSPVVPPCGSSCEAVCLRVAACGGKERERERNTPPSAVLTCRVCVRERVCETLLPSLLRAHAHPPSYSTVTLRSLCTSPSVVWVWKATIGPRARAANCFDVRQAIQSVSANLPAARLASNRREP